jgi:hypothetical protein
MTKTLHDSLHGLGAQGAVFREILDQAGSPSPRRNFGAAKSMNSRKEMTMARAYSEIAFTPCVRAFQTRMGSRRNFAAGRPASCGC